MGNNNSKCRLHSALLLSPSFNRWAAPCSCLLWGMWEDKTCKLRSLSFSSLTHSKVGFVVLIALSCLLEESNMTAVSSHSSAQPFLPWHLSLPPFCPRYLIHEILQLACFWSFREGFGSKDCFLLCTSYFLSDQICQPWCYRFFAAAFLGGRNRLFRFVMVK